MDRKQIEALVHNWETWARNSARDAEFEELPMGKRLILHGSTCYWNCASELREALGMPAIEPDTARVHAMVKMMQEFDDAIGHKSSPS